MLFIFYVRREGPSDHCSSLEQLIDKIEISYGLSRLKHVTIYTREKEIKRK